MLTDPSTAGSRGRCFYHSFPRPRPNEPTGGLLNRGWTILKSMRELGIVLAPEMVEWHSPVSLGPPNPTRVKQRRISFTELAPSELDRHSERFGPFALEFNIDALRRLGALPVIYMPQAIADNPLSLLGPIIVGHLDLIRESLEALKTLDSPNDPSWLAQKRATHINDNAVVRLGQSADSSEILWKHVAPVLDYLKLNNVPVGAMLGATSLLQPLFYPTDNIHEDNELGYYRQREWRITGDYHLNGKSVSRELSDEEKKNLLGIDKSFWSGQTHAAWQDHRVDEARVLLQPEDLFQSASRIIVPDAMECRARREFGERVVKASDLSDSP